MLQSGLPLILFTMPLALPLFWWCLVISCHILLPTSASDTKCASVFDVPLFLFIFLLFLLTYPTIYLFHLHLQSMNRIGTRINRCHWKKSRISRIYFSSLSTLCFFMKLSFLCFYMLYVVQSLGMLCHQYNTMLV